VLICSFVFTGLVDDVLEVLNQQDEEDAAYILAQEEERQREEQLRKKVGVLAYDGYMEKKSPAHNLWQVQFLWTCELSAQKW
jgi:pyruvate-formate lyase